MAGAPEPERPPQDPSAATSPRQLLDGIPWYRRSRMASALLVLSLLLGFGGPLLLGGVMVRAGATGAVLIGVLLGAPLLLVCVVVLTGEVYLEALDDQGQLRKWGVANKVVAAVIVLWWLYSALQQLL